MIYGYARISKKTQNIERQIRNIKALYPESIIIIEKYTGTTTNRKELNKLVKMVKAGDKIVFDSVSRMSRTAEDGFALYEELFNRGVELEFLNERYIDTETYKTALSKSLSLTGTNLDFILDGINKYLLSVAKEQIKLAFEQAEKEVQDLHQRTREGMETARLNGKQIGLKQGTKLTTKKSITAKEQIKKYSKDFDGTLKDGEVIRLLGIARNTFYKYKKEIFEEL